MDQVFKVKLIKARRHSFWYSKYIGKEFKVIQAGSKPDYEVISENPIGIDKYNRLLILKTDCRVIAKYKRKI